MTSIDNEPRVASGTATLDDQGTKSPAADNGSRVLPSLLSRNPTGSPPSCTVVLLDAHRRPRKLMSPTSCGGSPNGSSGFRGAPQCSHEGWQSGIVGAAPCYGATGASSSVPVKPDQAAPACMFRRARPLRSRVQLEVDTECLDVGRDHAFEGDHTCSASSWYSPQARTSSSFVPGSPKRRPRKSRTHVGVDTECSDVSRDLAVKEEQACSASSWRSRQAPMSASRVVGTPNAQQHHQKPIEVGPHSPAQRRQTPGRPGPRDSSNSLHQCARSILSRSTVGDIPGQTRMARTFQRRPTFAQEMLSLSLRPGETNELPATEDDKWESTPDNYMDVVFESRARSREASATLARIRVHSLESVRGSTEECINRICARLEEIHRRASKDDLLADPQAASCSDELDVGQDHADADTECERIKNEQQMLDAEKQTCSSLWGVDRASSATMPNFAPIPTSF